MAVPVSQFRFEFLRDGSGEDAEGSPYDSDLNTFKRPKMDKSNDDFGLAGSWSAFDEEFARLRGINIEAYYILLLCMIALTIVLLIQIVGLILVMALLILPAASAVQFSDSIPRMMVIAVVLSAFITTGGLMLSYQLDLPSGATIIVIAGFVYFLSIVSKRIRSA